MGTNLLVVRPAQIRLTAARKTECNGDSGSEQVTASDSILPGLRSGRGGRHQRSRYRCDLGGSMDPDPTTPRHIFAELSYA